MERSSMDSVLSGAPISACWEEFPLIAVEVHRLGEHFMGGNLLRGHWGWIGRCLFRCRMGVRPPCCGP